MSGSKPSDILNADQFSDKVEAYIPCRSDTSSEYYLLRPCKQMHWEKCSVKLLRFGLLVAVFLCVFSRPSLLQAGEPTQQLSATINDFVVILTSTTLAELRSYVFQDRAIDWIYYRFDFV